MRAARVAGRVLCVVADRATFGMARLREVLPAVLALAGPRTIVIDRGDGDAEARKRLAYLVWLKSVCQASGALLMVSRRVDLALAAGAAGVHLPESGIAQVAVRATWPDLVIGRSCHDRAGLEAASLCADYALLSPVATPTSKPSSSEPLGIAGFSRSIAGLSLPVFGLGGVTPRLAAELRRVGAAGVATLGDVLGAADPPARAAEMLRAWDGGAG